MTQIQAGPLSDTLRVLLIDHRPERRLLMRHLVLSTGLARDDVSEAADQAQALGLIQGDERDVAVVEIQLPVDRGLETIAALKAQAPQLRVVVCSFQADPETKALAMAAGADTYLNKPASMGAMRDVFQEILDGVADPT